MAFSAFRRWGSTRPCPLQVKGLHHQLRPQERFSSSASAPFLVAPGIMLLFVEIVSSRCRPAYLISYLFLFYRFFRSMLSKKWGLRPPTFSPYSYLLPASSGICSPWQSGFREPRRCNAFEFRVIVCPTNRFGIKTLTGGEIKDGGRTFGWRNWFSNTFSLYIFNWVVPYIAFNAQ